MTTPRFQSAVVARLALAVISILLASCPGGSSKKSDAGSGGKPPGTTAPALGCNEPCEVGECAPGLVCASNIHVGNSSSSKVCAPAECNDCYTGLLCNFSESCEFESCGAAQVGACFLGEGADRTCWQAHAAMLGSQYADAHRVCDNRGGHDFMPDACCADLGFAELCPTIDSNTYAPHYYDGDNECGWACGDEPCMHVESCDDAPARICGDSCGSSFGVCGEGFMCYQLHGKGPCEAEWCTGTCGPPSCEYDAWECGEQCIEATGCVVRECTSDGRCPSGEVCHDDGCCLARAFCDGARCDAAADCPVEGDVCDVNGCCVSDDPSAGTGGAGGGGAGAGGSGGSGATLANGIYATAKLDQPSFSGHTQSLIKVADGLPSRQCNYKFSDSFYPCHSWGVVELEATLDGTIKTANDNTTTGVDPIDGMCSMSSNIYYENLWKNEGGVLRLFAADMPENQKDFMLGAALANARSYCMF